MRFAYIVDEQIVEFRDLPEDIEHDSMLRPVVVVPYDLPMWQFVRSLRYDIYADHVDEVAELEDRLLEDVKRDRIAELEQLFALQRGQGFEFEGARYPLTTHSLEHQDLVRRGPPTGTRTPRKPPPTNSQQWLQAADEALWDLFVLHDNHVIGINETTTPEEAGTYDINAGWPAIPTEPETL